MVFEETYVIARIREDLPRHTRIQQHSGKQLCVFSLGLHPASQALRQLSGKLKSPTNYLLRLEPQKVSYAPEFLLFLVLAIMNNNTSIINNSSRGLAMSQGNTCNLIRVIQSSCHINFTIFPNKTYLVIL